MDKIKDNIIGQKIIKVIYSEVNHHKGKFYFDEFDTFDYGLNIQMENGYWWNLYWKDEEYFEFGLGEYYSNKHINIKEVKIWDATERWKEFLNHKVNFFNIKFIGNGKLIPEKIEIQFEDKKRVSILVAEELNLDESLPFPLEYSFNGEIYVFYN